jgi:hypothetical protein
MTAYREHIAALVSGSSARDTSGKGRQQDRTTQTTQRRQGEDGTAGDNTDNRENGQHNRMQSSALPGQDTMSPLSAGARS